MNSKNSGAQSPCVKACKYPFAPRNNGMTKSIVRHSDKAIEKIEEGITANGRESNGTLKRKRITPVRITDSPREDKSKSTNTENNVTRTEREARNGAASFLQSRIRILGDASSFLLFFSLLFIQHLTKRCCSIPPQRKILCKKPLFFPHFSKQNRFCRKKR